MSENFQLSSHAISLGVLEKARYIEKLKLVRCDCPYFIPENFWKYGPALAGFIPPTSKEEIFMQLIVKHSPLTLEQYRASKNLEAEKYLERQWVKCYASLPLPNGLIVVKAKVTYSQSTNSFSLVIDPFTRSWSSNCDSLRLCFWVR